MQPIKRHQAAFQVTLLGAVLNFLLAIAKMVCGTVGHSHALFADGIHSLSDLLSDGLVMIASRYGNQVADADHPYGHRRIETAATVAVALLLILAGFFIAVDAIRQLLNHAAVVPNQFVLWVGLFALLVNELLYRLTLAIAEKSHSDLLKAHAWHRRSDAATSLLVVLGIGASLWGFSYIDNLTAIAVAMLIIKVGYELGFKSLRELVDTGLTGDILAKISAVISSVSGVQMIHQLRTRSMGENILVDVHILVNAYLTVSEGHFIGQQVHYALMREIPTIQDVTVHVDPEDDEHGAVSLNLPSRTALLASLTACWQGLPGAKQIQEVRIHYLAGKIQIEVVLPLSLITVEQHDHTKLLQLYRVAAMESVTDIVAVSLYYYSL